jgi:hypothetical protein
MPERSATSWFWITVLSVLLIVAVPFLVVCGILFLPPLLALVATVGIIILWGVVAGYKDYVISKRRNSEENPEQA